MAATATDKMQSTNANAISANPAKSHSIAKRQNKNINSTINDTIRPTGNITITMPSTSTSAFTSQYTMVTDDKTEHDCNKNHMTETQPQNNDDKIDLADASAFDLKAITNPMESPKPSRRGRQTKYNQLIQRNEFAKGEIEQKHCGCVQIPIEHIDLVQDDKMMMAPDVSSVSFFSFQGFFLSIQFHLSLFALYLGFFFSRFFRFSSCFYHEFFNFIFRFNVQCFHYYNCY